MKLSFLSFLALMASGLGAAPIHGVVFADRNGDARREAGEPGLAGVAVSDGRNVVLTDANGRYTLPASDQDFVFVIKPRGWRPPVDGRNLPQFYHRLTAAASLSALDFPLLPSPEPDDFQALILTDTQPASPREVGYFTRTIVDRLAGRRDFAFGATLGDIAFDRPDLYPAVNAALSRIGIPWYSLNGNHDLDLDRDARHSTATFEATYGPSTYAFRCGGALFISLNDVRPLGGPRYIGGFGPDQWSFLAELLRSTPPDVLVVPMMHIHLFAPDPSSAEAFRPADRARFFGLLQSHPHLLILTGHAHSQRHVFYGPAEGWQGAAPLHEYNVGAADGGFWGGPPDAQGIPVATMADGTPQGYAELSFHGTAVRIHYQPTRHPADYQIGVHVPAAVPPKQGYVSCYANVFNGHAGWKVESRVDVRGWLPMRWVLGWDPNYAGAYLAQDTATHATPPPRLPDPAICWHLWRAFLPADLSLGTHALTVRATDPDGKVYSASQTFAVRNPADRGRGRAGPPAPPG